MDTFATELVSAEMVGPCVRLIFATQQNSLDGGGAERVVVAKLVVPSDVVRQLPIDLPALLAAKDGHAATARAPASLN